MLKTVICDDERPALDLLRAMIEGAGGADIVGAFQSVAEALERINQGGVDLVFFDVETPELSGVDGARAITVTPKPLLIFATAHPEYAVDAFGIDAIDYILKPFDRDRVLKAVEKAARLDRLIRGAVDLDPVASPKDARAGADDALRVRDAGRLYIIPYTDIVWIEAAGDYSLVHRIGGETVIRRTLNSLEAELPAAAFRRVHRSTIIALASITEVRKLAKGEAELLLHGDVRVRASRSYRAVIAEILG